MTARLQILLFIFLAIIAAAAFTNRDRIAEGVARLTSRGIRNNNPGNIRFSDDQWQGLAAEQTDEEFFVFSAPEWGIRAMARILTNYQSRHGLGTVREIINRWAPPSENDTDAYVRSVARQTGLDADAPINVGVQMFPLVSAIIVHENGQNPFDSQVIGDGIARAA